MKKAFIILVLLFALAGLFNYRTTVKDYWLKLIEPELPETVEYQPAGGKMPEHGIQEKTAEEELILPESYNLAVPFASQAPEANWQMPFKEACEEASALMVDYYYKNKEFTPQTAAWEIVKMVGWQEDYFGGHYDLTAQETKEMIEKYLGYGRVEVIDNPSVEEIKRHLVEKRPV